MTEPDTRLRSLNGPDEVQKALTLATGLGASRVQFCEPPLGAGLGHSLSFPSSANSPGSSLSPSSSLAMAGG